MASSSGGAPDDAPPPPPSSSSSPPSSSASKMASSLKSPGSIAFSSAPVAPVVVNSHNRRQSDAPWSKTALTKPTDDENASNNSSLRQGRQQQERTGRGSAGAASPDSFGSSDPSEVSCEDDRPLATRRAVTMSLPSISGAALLQLRSGGGGNMNSIQPAEKREAEQFAISSGVGAGPAGRSSHYRRSRSRSRERRDGNLSSRWRTSDPSSSSASNTPKKDPQQQRLEDPIHTSGSSYSGSGATHDDPSSPEDREIRIMFHGREIYADDLIGLRVAKTFVGHGRFLGQVVKFDEPTSLYTVVYADGDAEELNIDNTIQILIQDEIERADPSLPPVSSAFAKEAYPCAPDSPETAESMASGPPQPPAPQPQQPQRPPQVQAPPSGRLAVQISEREAQFVVGLFENHALPALLREGWRIQTSPSGTEQRFYAPPGNFPGAGRVFPTALSVVELIASEDELLSMCFPQNVHSAILSLFPEASRIRDSSNRKRMSSSQAEVALFDGKRRRAGREDVHGSSPMRSAAALNPVPRHGNPEEQQRVYPSEDMHREREPYAADRVPPLSSSDRFGGMHPGLQDGGGDYRRALPPGDGVSGASLRSVPPENPGARWSGHASAPNFDSTAAEYRRRPYADSPEWRDREMSSRGPYAAGPSSSSYPDGHSRIHGRSEKESSYYGDRSQSRPGMRAGADSADASYRYQEMRGSPARGSSGGEQQFHHRRVSSGRAVPAPSDDQVSHRESAPPEYRSGVSIGERIARRDPTLAPSAGGGGRGPSFSMMDVDRNSNPRVGVSSSSASLMEHARAVGDTNQSKWENHHHRRPTPEQQGYEQMERGRSPHMGESSNQGYAPPPGHHHRHQQQQMHRRHQRSASNGSNYSNMDPNGSSSSSLASGSRAPSEMPEQRTASPGNNSKASDPKRAII